MGTPSHYASLGLRKSAAWADALPCFGQVDLCAGPRATPRRPPNRQLGRMQPHATHARPQIPPPYPPPHADNEHLPPQVLPLCRHGQRHRPPTHPEDVKRPKNSNPYRPLNWEGGITKAVLSPWAIPGGACNGVPNRLGEDCHRLRPDVRQLSPSWARHRLMWGSTATSLSFHCAHTTTRSYRLASRRVVGYARASRARNRAHVRGASAKPLASLQRTANPNCARLVVLCSARRNPVVAESAMSLIRGCPGVLRVRRRFEPFWGNLEGRSTTCNVLCHPGKRNDHVLGRTRSIGGPPGRSPLL